MISTFLFSDKKTGKIIMRYLFVKNFMLVITMLTPWIFRRFLGNSWASGIALFGSRPYLNGRNQESSSEAIAAYEGVAMFGSVMMKAFGHGLSPVQSDNENANTACRVYNIGRFLATTEIRSADRYW
jgi:hypothetical protein